MYQDVAEAERVALRCRILEDPGRILPGAFQLFEFSRPLRFLDLKSDFFTGVCEIYEMMQNASQCREKWATCMYFREDQCKEVEYNSDYFLTTRVIVVILYMLDIYRLRK